MSENPENQNQPLEGHAAHAREAAKTGVLGFAVVTLSDTRTAENDKSGQYLHTAIAAAGHRVVQYAVVKDEPADVAAQLQSALDDPEVAIIVTNGGTGIATRDTAYESVVGMLEKQLDGFGELFRMLSYEEIGAAAMLSRAVAGIAAGRVIFSLPGSTKAVQLGMEKLILPQAGHLYYELHKDGGTG
ncbi:Molybdenum cofactor biosynthesis protein B [Symmachiella dynata]|uniref:Molybdenum cofactor biosynthesis protein B n=1 Tax=Symmachiella dynata TaxID=2527995 RepID=A0A517ZUW2_9PLAN|nr:MogA/MoaB family molybdenum cofactor biosynthesis protein [Symmachiella dynata]QDT50613.1 Molybdenum cofactor biosynthesis protein B [Symmachiella dynata]QDU46267.1 Molybdenum cofactor biosynthesis protein B [Symmachiella dynata]